MLYRLLRRARHPHRPVWQTDCRDRSEESVCPIAMPTLIHSAPHARWALITSSIIRRSIPRKSNLEPPELTCTKSLQHLYAAFPPSEGDRKIFVLINSSVAKTTNIGANWRYLLHRRRGS